MDYRPRYAQPFTLQEARQLDVPIITEEISRLQNSIAHLEKTQTELREVLGSAEDDPDLVQALEENDGVIGSQKERISMLMMVLAEKGVSTSSGHYDLAPLNASNRLAPPNGSGLPPSGRDREETNGFRTEQTDPDEGENGVYL